MGQTDELTGRQTNGWKDEQTFNFVVNKKNKSLHTYKNIHFLTKNVEVGGEGG